MNAVQIVCIIGMCLMSFVIGRATKRFKLPIMGTLIFKDKGEEPKLVFKCKSFEELEQQNYIAIKIESRQNHSL